MTSIAKYMKDVNYYRSLSIYTILNGLQVLLCLVFQIMFAKLFGKSMYADVYFVGTTMLAFCSALSTIFIEMFMQYYNDVKVQDSVRAASFYQCVYNLSAVIGVLTSIIVFSCLTMVIHLFAPGFDANKVNILKSFFYIYGCNIAIAGLVNLNISLLNAEMRFMLPYLLGLLPPVMNIIFLVIAKHNFGLEAIAISTFMSGIIILVIYQIYIYKKFNICLGKSFYHPELKSLLTNSISLRLGHQLWDSKDIIITNYLSRYPTGTVSLYFYAMRVISVLYTVTNSPIVKIYTSKVARYVATNEIGKIKIILNNTFRLNTLFFVIVTLPFVVFLPNLFSTFFNDKFSLTDIKTIHIIFMTLIPFYIILSIETLLTNLIVALKRSIRVLTINVQYIIVFCICLFSFEKIFGIYSIPISLALAQCVNLLAYAYTVKNYFDIYIGEAITETVE